MKRMNLFSGKNFLFATILVAALFGCKPKTEVAKTNAEYDPRWTNEIYPAIQEALVGGGFQMEGYWVWCGSVIKGDDGLFHLFGSRWPKELPFHPGWMIA